MPTTHKNLIKKSTSTGKKKLAEAISEKSELSTSDSDISNIAQNEIAFELTPVSTEETALKEKYYEAVGRHKDATARIRLFTRKATDIMSEDHGLIVVNQKSHLDYFPGTELQALVENPLRKLKSLTRFKASALVKGGGVTGQAKAIHLGIARALVVFDQNYRKKLKKAGYLTRDPREKERRKYGLKKARRAPQWSKR